jgi:hypothetical protein
MNSIATINKNKAKIYGSGLNSLYSLLRNLRIKYKEFNKSSKSTRYIYLSDFGIKIPILFSRDVKMSKSRDEKTGIATVTYVVGSEIKQQEEFGIMLMMELIQAGFFRFIRHSPAGDNERIYKELLIKHGWGMKILNTRLEVWENQPTRKFLYDFTKELVDNFSMPQIIAHYPDIFDYLVF